MTHGGAAAEEADGVRPAAGAERTRGRFSWPRRHPWLASAMALAVVAGGVAVPLALGDGDPSCRQLPASTRALAGNPAAATKALDPRDDMSHFPALRALLPTGRLCGDGGRVLGTVVAEATGTADAGTTATAADHTPAQARAVWAVVVVYGGSEVPPGAEPGLARMLAGYIADTTRAFAVSLDAKAPAVSARSATATDETGWSRFGAFLSPGDAHPDFAFDQDHAVGVLLGPLFDGLARDPQAFAILYGAERAYLAHYLERLTDKGTDPGYHPGKGPKGRKNPETRGVDSDLDDLARRVGGLMRTRSSAARAGHLDLAAYDRSVRRHTRGAYRAAPTRLTTRPPMGGIAGRPVSGPVRGDLMDGREQLSRTLGAWAKARKVPAARAAAMRQILDDGYIWAFRGGST
ncbi:hypothetical protein [Streptomyces murinus]|uniref:hypothetical protein n=1 Tax=Streptomyces murinus TaxID=33900 RepID=UPI002E1611E0|nr:hypothetical protein OG516_05260 [Streptomyces murinus]